jgi:hypothetical protein
MEGEAADRNCHWPRKNHRSERDVWVLERNTIVRSLYTYSYPFLNFTSRNVLGIPTRFDTEYFWMAAPDGLTVRGFLWRSVS